MSGLRRTKPLIEKCCNALSSRSFHTASSFAAKPKQSPRIKQKIARAQGAVVAGTARVRKTIDPEDALPPITLLNSASKSGALDISPAKALEVLREYQELAQKPSSGWSSGWERKLCDDHNISPSTLALVGRILNRCPSDAQRHLARKLALTASLLGEKSATIDLIEAAILKETLHLQEFALPLQRLGSMAKQDQDPQAMALLGRVMLTLAKDDDALSWFRQATREGVDFDGAAEALVQEGRILLGRKDKEGAEKAFRKAALELDDPSGYFYLSQLQRPGSSEQEVYLLKAASSGIAEACHNLGSRELEKIKERPKGAESFRDFNMAREWFEVAAAEGFGLSMLNLALICKAGGKDEEGLGWLEKAEDTPGVRDEARRVREQWGKQKIEIA